MAGRDRVTITNTFDSGYFSSQWITCFEFTFTITQIRENAEERERWVSFLRQVYPRASALDICNNCAPVTLTNVVLKVPEVATGQLSGLMLIANGRA